MHQPDIFMTTLDHIEYLMFSAVEMKQTFQCVSIQYHILHLVVQIGQY